MDTASPNVCLEALTDEEFKAEAKRRGYNLIKITKKVKLLPCVCGSNRRSKWYSTKEHGWLYKCDRCDMKSPTGKTHRQAMINWNDMIREKMNESM